MKVGDYVRTKNGLIAKILEVDNTSQYSEIILKTDTNVTIWCSCEKDLKSSPNIIDLIEVEDYVNGHLVIDIAQAPKKSIYIEDANNKMAHIPYLNEDIKSIVTKEQFSQMEYKIESVIGELII